MSITLLFLLTMVPGTIFLGFSDVLGKKILSADINEHLMISIGFGGVGIIASSMLFFTGIPDIREGFWGALAGTVFLNIFAQWFFLKAFKKEEASLVSPLRLLSPPLTLLTGLIILGEKPGLFGILGVLTTFVGLWFLLTEGSGIRRISVAGLLRRPGLLYGIAGALAFAVSLPLDKKAVVASSAFLFIALAFLVIAAGNFLIGWSLAESRRTFYTIPKETARWLPLYILALAGGALLTVQALNYAFVAYASSVKRLWSLWAILFSGAFLKEKHIGRKLIGAGIMLSGIALTLL